MHREHQGMIQGTLWLGGLVAYVAMSCTRRSFICSRYYDSGAPSMVGDNSAQKRSIYSEYKAGNVSDALRTALGIFYPLFFYVLGSSPGVYV